MKHLGYEVKRIDHTQNGTYMIRIIDVENGQELDLVGTFHDLAAMGVKSIVSHQPSFKAYKIKYKSIIVSFENDDRRYIINYYRRSLNVWSQCINILKCIESKSVLDVKALIDSLGYKSLINEDLMTIRPNISQNMYNKIEYVRYLYNANNS
jgi:hypothetical protein